MTAYMQNFGWQPTVLTAHSNGTLNIQIPEHQIIRIGNHHQKKAKIDEKYFKWKTDINPLINIIRTTTKSRLLSLDASIFGWYRVVLKQFPTIINKVSDMDMVIGSYKPVASHKVAKKIANHLDIPWIADFRDMGAMRNFQSNKMIKKIDEQIEKINVSTASGIISVSKQYVQALSSSFNKPGELIYNGYFDRVEDETNDSFFPKTELTGKYIHYAGRFQAHRLPAIELLLRALQKFPEMRLILRSLGPVSSNNIIEAMVKNYELTDQVEILPPASPERINSEQKKASLNVVFEDISDDSPWGPGLLTGKFLQLLPGSIPILSVCQYNNEMTEILCETGRGKSCSSVDEIITLLDKVNSTDNIFESENELTSKYSAQYQAKKLCKFMNKILQV